MTKRLEFAKLHRNDYITFWKNVIFNDESKFNILACDRKQREHGGNKHSTAMVMEKLLPIVKHGGRSVMAWRRISEIDCPVYLNLLKLPKLKCVFWVTRSSSRITIRHIQLSW